MAKERLQKILAQAGISSRRKAEQLIREGQVKINGKVAQIGDKAEWGEDAIKLGNQLLLKPVSPVYFAFNKPRGVISMFADPQNRPHLGPYFDKIKTRLFPVGRLDFNSDGLLLLTNDGEFAQKLQKLDAIPKIYHVKIKGLPDVEAFARLQKESWVGENRRRVSPHSVRIVQKLPSKSVIEVVLLGGAAYDLKAFFEMKGFLVDKVTRIGIGQVLLKSLKPGEYRPLKKSQVDALTDHPELAMRRIEWEREKSRGVAPRSIPVKPLTAPKVVITPTKPSSIGYRPRTSDGLRASTPRPRSSTVRPRSETTEPRSVISRPKFKSSEPRSSSPISRSSSSISKSSSPGARSPISRSRTSTSGPKPRALSPGSKPTKRTPKGPFKKNFRKGDGN